MCPSWQNSCGNSTCKSIIVFVNIAPIPPLSASSDRNNFCPGVGGTIALSVTGGYGITTGWFNISCGSGPIGTGNPIVLSSPTTSIIYWANLQVPACTNTSCVSIEITVSSNSIAADSITTANKNIGIIV